MIWIYIQFVLNIWSPFEGVRNTWCTVKSIKHFLDSIGCKYKIFRGVIKDYDKKEIEMFLLVKDNF